MKIAVLEKVNFNNNQIDKLKSIASVDFYDSLSQEQANEIAPNYDIVVVNWLDPTPFILSMKNGSLVSLLSTGYGWITNLKEASEKGVLVSNIPGYSTEAVAEHLLGLLIGVSKNIFCSLNVDNCLSIGFELKDKTIGIIGLGQIGTRFAEMMNFFGANVLTYNRHKKDNAIAKDVSLEELMKSSDIVCITCSVNNESKGMINLDNYTILKKGVIVIGSTWDVIEEDAIIEGVKNDVIKCIAFDAATEGASKVSEKLINSEYNNRVFLTPHIAYNTLESETRQLDICVNNIISFAKGTPINIVN